MSSGEPRQLTEREREFLAFERLWWRLGRTKDDAVRDRLGTDVADYYRTLNAVIDHDGALEHDPRLVRRLRRQRLARRLRRAVSRQDG